MTDDMLERMAVAMEDAAIPDERLTGMDASRRRAFAALKALGSPTPLMLEAGTALAAVGMHREQDSTAVAASVFRVMIATALGVALDTPESTGTHNI